MTPRNRTLLARIHAEWARQLAAWLSSVADAGTNFDLTDAGRAKQVRDSYAVARRIIERGVPIDCYLFAGRRRLNEAERAELIDLLHQFECRGLLTINGDLVRLTSAGLRAVEYP